MQMIHHLHPENIARGHVVEKKKKRILDYEKKRALHSKNSLWWRNVISDCGCYLALRVKIK